MNEKYDWEVKFKNGSFYVIYNGVPDIVSKPDGFTRYLIVRRCPRCKGIPNLSETTYTIKKEPRIITRRWQMFCTECGIQSVFADGIYKATEMWNRVIIIDKNIKEKEMEENNSISNVNFVCADLPNMNFRYADLCNAEFNNANLQGADFTGANLSNADFSYASLNKAIFENANLSNAEFYNSQLTNANMSNVNAWRTDFSNASLIATDFSYANLEEAVFTNSNAKEANFSNASLINAKLENANFRRVTLCKTNLTGIRVNEKIKL